MKVKQIDVHHPQIADTLALLQKECLPVDTPYDTTTGYWWIVYDSSNTPCAFAGLVPSARWLRVGYLCRAGVLPGHRGRGTQKRLIRARVRQARKLGWEWLISDTYNNPASANSLISCGFKMFEPSQPWGAKGTLYWRLKL
jgi:GNAT superfamily N-acetyltransferase